MISMNDFNIHTLLLVTLISLIKSEETTYPICPPGSGLSLTKDDDPCHCRQCHSGEYARSSDNTCVPCQPSSCEETLRRHTLSRCKPDANVECGSCLSRYDEPEYGATSKPCQEVVDSFPWYYYVLIAIVVAVVLVAVVVGLVVAWLVYKKKCRGKPDSSKRPIGFDRQLPVSTEASTDDELTHVTTERESLLRNLSQIAADGATSSSPLDSDSSPRQADFNNVSSLPGVANGTSRQSNGAIVSSLPVSESTPDHTNGVITMSSDVDDSAPTSDTNDIGTKASSSDADCAPTSDTNGATVSSSVDNTPSPNNGTAMPSVADSAPARPTNDTTVSSDADSASTTQRFEHRRVQDTSRRSRLGNKRSCHRSTPVMADRSTMSVDRRAVACADACSAQSDTDSTQTSVEGVILKQNVINVDESRIMSSVAVSRQVSQATDSSEESGEQACASAASSEVSRTERFSSIEPPPERKHDQTLTESGPNRMSESSNLDAFHPPKRPNKWRQQFKCWCNDDGLLLALSNRHSSRIECWVIRWPTKLQTKMDVFLRHLQLDDTILANCVAGKLITAEQMNAIEFVNGRVALDGKRKFFDLMVKMSPLSVSALASIFDKELNEPMAQALQHYLNEVLRDMGLSLHDFSDRKRKSSNIDVRTQTVRY